MTVTIHTVYFTATGKFYAQAEGEFDPAIFQNCFTPAEVGRELRRLKQLPGIQSGIWNNPFTITFSNVQIGDRTLFGYPELVL